MFMVASSLAPQDAAVTGCRKLHRCNLGCV